MRLQARGDRGVVQSVVLFLGVSVLSGALAAGLVIPFAGLLGFGTEKTSETFEKLPTELQQQPLPVRSRIVAADGSQIAYIYDQNRVNVRLSQVTSIMKKAIIAVESMCGPAGIGFVIWKIVFTARPASDKAKAQTA